MILGEPPEDPALSPYTGWTRAHWAGLADRMLAALDPYRSPKGAFVDLPGPASANGERSDGLEGFARSLLLAGFRVLGEGGADPAGVLERYAEGLAAGTDPHSPEHWPRPDELGQAKVEAASIALILQATRPWLWDRLPDGVRERTVDWLATVIGQPYPPINWVWFRVMVESFLREAGGPWSREDVEADLAVHAGMRRSGGWLADSLDLRAYDHYTGWALHLYPLLWTHFFDVNGTLCPPELRRRWEEDLAGYLGDAVRLFGADGSPLLQGRSLTYRFAAAAPLWTGALTGAGGLPPGLTRRAASGTLRYFERLGALEPDAVLRLGWGHEWPAMRQSYSGPGSPYWAAKGMLGLALPADHPVWTDVELPLPVEESDISRVIGAPGWLLHARARDGVATIVNHGTDHESPGDVRGDSPVYARFGYSTATVPPLTGPTTADPLDNSVVLLDDEGRATHRTGFETLYADQLAGSVLVAASRGRAHWVETSADTGPDHGSGRRGPAVPGPVVTVASVVRDGVEVRLVRVDAGAEPGSNSASRYGKWGVLRLGGWPLAGDPAPSVTVSGAQGTDVEISRPGLRCRLRGLLGFGHGGAHTEEGTGPLARWTAVPWLATDGAAPAGQLLAASLRLDRGVHSEAGEQDPELTVEAAESAGLRVTLRWPDGRCCVLVLPAPETPAADVERAVLD